MKFSKEPKTGGGAGEYLKLKDGESVVGVFRGDPLEYHHKWVDKKSVKCESNEEGARFRFRINFVVKAADGTMKSVIWEQGPTVYNALKAINADYELEKHFMKVSRKGSGLNDTEYVIMPYPNGALDEAKEATVAAVALQDLSADLHTGPLAPKATNLEDELPF